MQSFPVQHGPQLLDPTPVTSSTAGITSPTNRLALHGSNCMQKLALLPYDKQTVQTDITRIWILMASLTDSPLGKLESKICPVHYNTATRINPCDKTKTEAGNFY